MSVFKKQKQRGFTLIELLVTISIFVILTGVVLFNQTKFNSTILLTNLAYDTGLTIRQAQTYGINIKEFNDDGTARFLPYGVHFEKGVNNKSFILFADLDYDPLIRISDGLYPTDADVSGCEARKGCVTRYNIKRGNYIKDICAEEVAEGVFECGNIAGVSTSRDTLDVTFVRPNPDAFLRFDGSTATSPVATIILGGVDGSTRKVRIRSNGLIEIVN
jgi:prepilin-type N-terminal cleavage/methylation domain-containing protein